MGNDEDYSEKKEIVFEFRHIQASSEVMSKG